MAEKQTTIDMGGMYCGAYLAVLAVLLVALGSAKSCWEENHEPLGPSSKKITRDSERAFVPSDGSESGDSGSHRQASGSDGLRVAVRPYVYAEKERPSLADKIRLAVLRHAVSIVESDQNPKAIGDNGEAIGILQIHRILVDDVNRILGKSKYTHDDRWNPVKSAEMFDIYSIHYANAEKDWTDKGIARRWNGGPKGHLKRATVPYWHKVKSQLERKGQN